MVWDLPTRLFHWGFVVSIIGAYISGERGALGAHEYFGLAAFGLLVFRLIWGFIGHETARFSHFLPSLGRLFSYLKSLRTRRHSPIAGHNPLGALAVFALLGLMGSMAITGLWTGDDILYEAPLPLLGVAPHWADPMGAWHQNLHRFVIPLIALHVLAIFVHRLWLGEKLVSRMISGGQDGPMLNAKRTRNGMILLLLCVGTALSLSLVTPNFA